MSNENEVKEYELSGKFMQDVMEKVPPEKWDLVLDEMKDALRQFGSVIDMLNAVGESIKQHPELKFPDTITWRDDNGAGNEMHVLGEESEEDEAQELFIAKFTKEQPND